jgi:DNA polymerase I-like protein with 3'-5' exonuclease and polymerase domains
MLTVNNPKAVNWSDMPLAEMARGNALDTYFTLKCYDVLINKLEDGGMVDTYKNIIEPSTKFFVEVELDGLLISEPQLEKLGAELHDNIINIEDKLYAFKEVKKDISLKSSHDLVRTLFSLVKSSKDWVEDSEGYGFGLYPPIFTSKRQPSTSAEALDILKVQIKDELLRRGVKINETHDE